MNAQSEELVNPLAAWLKLQLGMRHCDFARTVHRREGTVTRWCMGTRHPKPKDQELIAAATRNAVRPTDWHAYYIARHPLEGQAA